MKRAFFRLLIQALAVLSLSGCVSDMVEFDPYKGKPHRVVFTIDPLPVSSAGLLLWGKNDRGDSFGRVITGNTVTVDLNSGNWTYYGMAWTGEVGDENANGSATDPMSGVISCAVETKQLKGDGKSYHTISTFSTSLCNNTAFAPPVHVTGTSVDYRIGNVKMNFCEDVTNITALGDTCSDDLLTGTPQEAKGHAMSYRLSLVSYDKDKKGYQFQPSRLSSGCLHTTNPGTPLNGAVPLNLPQIPAGDGGSTPFYIQLEAFPGSYTCDGTTHGYREVNFPNGIIQTSSNAKHFVDGNDHKVFVKMAGDEICKDQSLLQTFGGGNGLPAHPYLICSAAQLYNTISDTSSNFKLQKDIDLRKYFKGYSGSMPLPASITSSACLDDGSNFSPIGMVGCASPATDRTGYFDGGGKTITGMRILMNRTTSPDKVGFISRQGSEVRRLNFVEAKVIGKNEVGILAGRIPNSSALVRYISIDKSSLEGTGSIVGGIAGAGDMKRLEDVTVNKLQIKAASDAGSIIGSSNAIAPGLIGRRIFASGEVVASGSTVGGLIGNINNLLGADLEEVRFEGYVSGFNIVGGLIGNSGKLRLKSSYVQAGLYSTRTVNSFLGGLVGTLIGVNTNHTIQDSYFYGRIQHRCTSGVNCHIGNIFGQFDPSWVGNGPTGVSYSSPQIVGLQLANAIGTPVGAGGFLSSATVFPAAFSKLDGDVPRLSSEASTHPCRLNGANESVANQIDPNLSYKRGSASNPILICNAYQVGNLGAGLNLNYKLAGYFFDWGGASVPGASFSGKMDGDNFGFIGTNIYATAIGDNISGFNNMSGTFSDLNFYVPTVTHAFASGSAALLANTNSGTISNLNIRGLKWEGPSGASLVNYNASSGTISNVNIDGFMKVKADTGGVAITNSGSMKNMTVSLEMTSTVAVTNVAGVVKENLSGGRISNIELNTTLETTGDASVNQSLVTTNNDAGAEISDVHLRSGTLKGSGKAAHAIATTNEGIISQLVNEASAFNKAETIVPALTPTTDAEMEALVTSTVGVDNGTLENIFYFNKARWIFKHAQRFGVYNGLFGVAPVQEGLNCIVDTTPSSVPKLQSTVWGAFIGVAGGGIGRLFFSPTELGTLDHEVLSTHPTRTPFPGDQYDSFKLFNNDCSIVVQASTTWLVYLPPDPHFAPLPTNELTAWSAWHSNLAAATTVFNLGDASDKTRLSEYQYKLANGLTSEVPVWVFTPGIGIRLYGR